jgi:hypothetical protein
MTRRSLSLTPSSQRPSLSRVWEWYEFQRSLIREEKSRLFGALARGESPSESRYLGKEREELDAEFAFQAAELGALSTLGILACTEAALQVDFKERVSAKRKDGLSRRFRRASKKRGSRIRLEEDILDVWRENSDTRIKRAVQGFKGALNLRHWLAHGRYWEPKLGRAARYDTAVVFEICGELLLAVGLTP